MLHLAVFPREGRRCRRPKVLEQRLVAPPRRGHPFPPRWRRRQAAAQEGGMPGCLARALCSSRNPVLAVVQQTSHELPSHRAGTMRLILVCALLQLLSQRAAAAGGYSALALSDDGPTRRERRAREGAPRRPALSHRAFSTAKSSAAASSAPPATRSPSRPRLPAALPRHCRAARAAPCSRRPPRSPGASPSETASQLRQRQRALAAPTLPRPTSLRGTLAGAACMPVAGAAAAGVKPGAACKPPAGLGLRGMSFLAVHLAVSNRCFKPCESPVDGVTYTAGGAWCIPDW